MGYTKFFLVFVSAKIVLCSFSVASESSGIEKSFAVRLAAWRQDLITSQVVFNAVSDVAALKQFELRFPEDYRNFSLATDMTLDRYLQSRERELNLILARVMIGPLLEYKPLTKEQWRQQTPEEVKKWKKAEALEQKFEWLSQRGEVANFSPEWIDLILDIRRMTGPVMSRYTDALMAKYTLPSTPETRSFSAVEARAIIERDWLHQVNNKPEAERILEEIKWTRQIASRIETAFPARIDFADDLAELADLAKKAAAFKGVDTQLYFRVRQVKNRVMFKNPVVDFESVLFVDMPLPMGPNRDHEARHRLGFMAVPGGRLLSLRGLSPTGKLTQIMPQAPLHGSFWRPDVSYDGTKILFCFKPHNEKSFHLYESNVDGTGLVQLTSGLYDDLDPIYLPDGHLMFSTTRGHTYVRCMPFTPAYTLARCESTGKNIYIISCNNEPDFLPSVMNDGMVIYTRWEYTDKALWRAQGLWTVRPDGMQVNTLWGNQSVWPDVLKDARSIPCSRRILFTGCGHHRWWMGSLGIIDPDKGSNFPNGLTKVTADVDWPESGNGPLHTVESSEYHASGKYGAYHSPYPLSEKDFLVSANRNGKFVLYLMDVDGNRELIYEGVHNILHALPLKPRPRPPVLVDTVAWPSKAERLQPEKGTLYSNNVYDGAPENLHGKAKFLRILTIEHKTYTSWGKIPYAHQGPVVSGVQADGVKRILGTVPIEPDGSVSFYVPSGIPLHFQLLDEHDRALQTMRSFTGVMPGERRGCVGCHELHSRAPASKGGALALWRKPSVITPPPWGEDTVSYPRYVRPMLDKYCAKCHEGAGKGREKLDLTARPGFLDFDETYWVFIGKPPIGSPDTMPRKPPPGWGIADMIRVEAYSKVDPIAYQTHLPMTRLSYKSRLVELVSSGKHHDVKVDPTSLKKLIAWVDAMCPYRGDDEIREIDDPVFAGIDLLPIRPKIKNAPRIVRPGPVD